MTPAVRTETPAEFLARGGRVIRCPTAAAAVTVGATISEADRETIARRNAAAEAAIAAKWRAAHPFAGGRRRFEYGKIASE